MLSSLDSIGSCWFCGTPLGAADYGRGDICPKCRRDTRTCKGCTFYDTTAHHECREPQTEWVADKERSNFCDYFKPTTSKDSPQADAATRAKEAAEALFKKK